MGAARVLAVGVQFGVFTHIAAGQTAVAEIARSAQASERGIRMLLNALVSLQFLTKAQDTYALTPVAAEFLVRERPFYLGQIMEGDWMWESWGHLADAVRTGQSFRHVDSTPAAAEPFFRAYIPMLYVVNLPGARRAAQVLVGHGVPAEGLRVLEIGCGSAVWSIAIAEAAGPTTRVTAQDFPGVLELTREYVRRHGVEQQYDFLPGDQRQVPLGTDQFDLAILARYVHELAAPAACDLFRRVFVALKRGGRIAVADLMPNNERTAPPGPLLFALRMLLHTAEGDAYTPAEYTRWLESVGFTDITVTPDIGTDVPLIVGVKP
jgi:ubiquinone/menaquinone biosynthesis C-methylase UbiE